ncbi:uncharacterized protein [Watersipora subatra]|uniref:uncharacterized protein n=1 Tax=Watersipora subatra TaxID=2589382 RepID=UPI00355C0B09
MLELQNRQKDAILKRKHEEVSQLRKRQRDSSASSRVMAKNRANLSHENSSGKTSSSSASRHKSAALLFSPKVAKSKWDKLERYSANHCTNYFPCTDYKCGAKEHWTKECKKDRK